MVQASENNDDSLPIVLIVHTPATSGSKDRLQDALKLKQGDAYNSQTKVWEIVTNYYAAKVKLETYELPLVAPHMLPQTSGDEENKDGDEWDTLFERNIQSVIYYLEDVEVSNAIQARLIILSCVGVHFMQKFESFRAGLQRLVRIYRSWFCPSQHTC